MELKDILIRMPAAMTDTGPGIRMRCLRTSFLILVSEPARHFWKSVRYRAGNGPLPESRVSCDGCGAGGAPVPVSGGEMPGFPGFRAVRADFMEYEVREQSMDLVYSATAFHWLPEKEAYEKVFRCLKKGGTAAFFWNHPFPNREEDKSNRASREVYEKFRPSGGKQVEFSEADCEATVRRMEQYGFIHVESRLYRRVRTLETEAYIGLLNTYSDHLSMEPRMKEAFEEEMRRAVNEAGGRISIYDTIDLYLGKRPE